MPSKISDKISEEVIKECLLKIQTENQLIKDMPLNFEKVIQKNLHEMFDELKQYIDKRLEQLKQDLLHNEKQKFVNSNEPILILPPPPILPPKTITPNIPQNHPPIFPIQPLPIKPIQPLPPPPPPNSPNPLKDPKMIDLQKEMMNELQRLKEIMRGGK